MAIEKQISVHLPTKYGEFELTAYVETETGKEHLALTRGLWSEDEPVLVRMHSSCMTGDIFGSFRCDCGSQLQEAMLMVTNAGAGAIVYLNQEGRGIGLINKLKAYKLQENGHDTVEANEELGFKPDERDFSVGVEILKDLGIQKLRLITNNPKKTKDVKKYGLEIVENVPLHCGSNTHNLDYLTTKRDKMGHTLPDENL